MRPPPRIISITIYLDLAFFLKRITPSLRPETYFVRYKDTKTRHTIHFRQPCEVGCASTFARSNGHKVCYITLALLLD